MAVSGDTCADPEQIFPLPWAARVSAMPYLPGGGEHQVDVLRAVLDAVVEHEGVASASVKVSGEVARPLQEWVKQLTSAGLVTRLDRGHFEVSSEALTWRQSSEPGDLLTIFHRQVRYVGELLHELNGGKRAIRALLEVANERYDLRWTTLDQVRRRVTWFICLGLVEYKTSEEIGLTELGVTWAKRLVAGSPEQAPDTADSTENLVVPQVPKVIAGVLISLSPGELESRNPVLGYIPRGKGETDVVQALTMLVNACLPQASRADLLNFSREKFGVKDSSFAAVLTTLTRSGLIEQTGFNIYSPTTEASAWLEDGSPLSLVLLLHSRYRFMLEIIPMLAEFDRATSLARAAAQHKWLTRVDASGVRTRLQLLKAAGLIFERTNWRYQPTVLGEHFAHTFPIQSPIEDGSGSALSVAAAGSGTQSKESPVAGLVAELTAAATAVEDPTRLERAVADAFTLLGFEARHIGGGGKTDVLATVDTSAGGTARVIIDAKASRSGAVAEGAVSFDTLREHKKQHRADHVVLVGPNFDSGRTKRRAEEHDVRILTVGELCATMMRHDRVPQSPDAYLRLVSGSVDDHREFAARWSQAERRVALLGHVTAVLASEARMRDEITGGALTADQIYLIVRDEIDPPPAAVDIEGVLKLLEHPLVESVVRTSSSAKVPAYQLRDSPHLVASKLEAVVRALQAIDVGE